MIIECCIADVEALSGSGEWNQHSLDWRQAVSLACKRLADLAIDAYKPSPAPKLQVEAA